MSESLWNVGDRLIYDKSDSIYLGVDLLAIIAELARYGYSERIVIEYNPSREEFTVLVGERDE